MHSIHAFAEKVALVAGASGPIGRAVSMQLALLGAFVVAVDSGADGDSDVSELQALGTLASAVDADVSTKEGAQKAVGAVESLFGRIDLLVNCVKSEGESAFSDADAGSFDRIVGQTLKAPYLLTGSAMRLMLERPKARIVTIVGGERNGGPLGSAMPAAVEAMTKALAAELPRSFRVNAVEVGNPECPPDDVARAALFLMSSEATAISGETLRVG